ncbi:MAG: 50S ribosomal protein L37e [Candidatus Aenigmarchaeota archaeon]|nr:50S ribosomal protein L37e [Candidatus Aenigmarchaeota archaeon]
MSKGTPSFGKHNRITHIRCRRCGRHAYHIRTSKCSSCGFGKSTKIRNESWRWKKSNTAKRSRKTMKISHMKIKTKSGK